MSRQVDLYNSTYGNFQAYVLAEIRRESYGEDIGQSSWITSDEYDIFYSWLNLVPGDHVLEVASGSGGPALYLAKKFGCRITGLDLNEERAARSIIGFFLFVPLEVTTNLITAAGLKLLRCEDVTGNIELTSGRWHASRQKHRQDLIKMEGKDRFEGLQKFLSTVHKMTSERQLSRFVFLVEK